MATSEHVTVDTLYDKVADVMLKTGKGPTELAELLADVGYNATCVTKTNDIPAKRAQK